MTVNDGALYRAMQVSLSGHTALAMLSCDSVRHIPVSRHSTALAINTHSDRVIVGEQHVKAFNRRGYQDMTTSTA